VRLGRVRGVESWWADRRRLVGVSRHVNGAKRAGMELPLRAASSLSHQPSPAVT
jgi:hypothetical protein